MKIRLVFVSVLLLALLSGCGALGYYAQSIGGQLDLMNRRQAIESLIDDPATPNKLRQRLRAVLDMRTFASTQLALPDNRSYRLYADIGREAVVWSVVAAPRFSVEPKRWCYPVVGCLSYRGYFSKPKADAYAAQLEAEGLDVAVNPVPAYSTLGWFDDPVPSSVIDWPEARLAGLIFHELAHQRLYVKGDTAFNEAFATAVQRLGVERWLTRARGRVALDEWHQALGRQRAFVALLLDTRDELALLYNSQVGEAAMAQGKRAVFDGLTQRYAELKRHWGGYDGFDRWFDQPVNNARLASIATYEQWVPAFLRLAESKGGDMAAFYQACEDLSQLPLEARHRELAKWEPQE